jgi:AraC-like DNA-binding protein
MKRSSRHMPKTEQNLPELPVLYSEMKLPRDFPVVLSGPHSFGDHAITFLHVHDCLELGYCVTGSGVFIIEGKVLPFRAGDVSVITSREAHFARSAAGLRSHWRWLWLNPLQLANVAVAGADELLATGPLSGGQFSNVISPTDAPQIATILRMAIAEADRRAPSYRLIVRGLMLALMGQLQRMFSAKRSATLPRRREDIARIAPALQHIASHYQGEVCISELAEMCRMSTQTLWRLFLAIAGCSPKKYLTRVRMQMATALLSESKRTILDVSLDVGYGSVSSFNRHFKTLKGISPRTWRRLAKRPS